ncbi:MAG: acyl-[ACP]--phospholipid O-acyltransferase, partial [Pseudomonadota bacterium]
ANAVLLGRELTDMTWLRHRSPEDLQSPVAPFERLVLGGTIAGGLALVSSGHGQGTVIPISVVAGLMVTFAALGYLSSTLIPNTGRAVPSLRITRNPLSSTIRLLGELREDRRLWIGGLVTSWFWMSGIVALSLLPTIIKEQIGGSETVVTLCLAVFTVGIATGSWLAAGASHHRPNLALVPIGAALMAAFSIYAAVQLSGLPPLQDGVVVTPAEFLAQDAGQHLIAALFGLSAAGGLFIVPSFAAVQAWAHPQRRARTIAAVNILNAAFMTVGSLGLAAAQANGATAVPAFVVIGGGSLVVAVLIARIWGREAIRDLGYALFRSAYRLEVKGRENLPDPGTRAIIAPNHVSFMDGPVLNSILPDHAAFAIDTGIAQAWWVKPFLKLIKSYLLDPTRPLATRHLVHEVKKGETLVIFPEGRLTVTGGLMKVYDGAAMIADKADAVVIPVRITGLERSFWSYLRKSQTRKQWFPKVTVEILPARTLPVDKDLRGKVRRQAASAALQDVMVAAAVETADFDRTLFQALTDAARERDTGKPIVEDPLLTKLSYRKLIIGAQALGAELAKTTAPGEAVGLMLPNAAGAAVTFFAMQTIGRVPAMLNFTAGPANVVSACGTAEVKTVVTSRAFVEKAHLEALVAAIGEVANIIYLEDVRPEIGFREKVSAMLRGNRPQVARNHNDPAAILFTSGSEGAPKAVVLSHRNILSNAIQSLTIVSADGEDKVFNVLPVFHAFGLTAGLVMPLIAGVPVFLYPSPLHYRIVPELVYQTNATIVFGTDTFLNGYARTAHPYDFRNVRMILAGAEQVKQRTRDIYMERFGTRILEGYGVTETAPVVAINTPLANRTGTVGRLLPMMEARGEPVPGITDGERLLLRGPNVMLGYYRAERPGVLEPPPDGWHDTGDIVAIDAAGFLTIKGRAKRFAKIGGEMVSLAAVEAMAAEFWHDSMSVVIAEPDPRKGERLVLVTERQSADRTEFRTFARGRGASDLMMPAEIMVVNRVPVLGSGKADYVATTELVAEQRKAVAAAE